ncbi:MAG: hypothetical protein LLG06_19800 [Desulfobacteraceae bacterium]|nr:hypothetical protein [Desulfobacteraceae bacterium]
MTTRECREGYKETVVGVKLWAIITLLILIFGGILSVLYARDTEQMQVISDARDRLIKLEEAIPQIRDSLKDIKTDVAALRNRK